MKLTPFLSTLALAAALLSGGDRTHGAESIEARRKAIAMYPELAKPGSPLNRKFLELYKRAKENDSPLLDDPDWAIHIAKQAAAAVADPARDDSTKPAKPAAKPEPVAEILPAEPPPPFKTGPVHFKVPVGDIPEFDPALPHGGNWKYHEFALNAQVIPPTSRAIPDENFVGELPQVWRTLSDLRRATKAQNLGAFRSLYVPEVWTREIQPALNRGGEAVLMRHLSAMAGDARVPIIVEAGGLVFPVLDGGAGRVSSLPLRADGAAFLIDEPKDLPGPTASALTDLESALRGFPVEELIVK